MRPPPLFQNHRGFSSFFRQIDLQELYITQQFPTRDFRPENMLVLISHFANSLRIMPSRIPYLTAWANGVARNGYCSG